MYKDQLYRMLSAECSPVTTINWLRTEYFPEIMARFNTDESRKRFGLYQNEKIPVNERNLTDVRTRMGVLIEFELARISNDLLAENRINDIFWSYVVANRFPDLEVRKKNGERLLRLEIKCLQCIAEEKSANFDTLKKDIDPNTDYVIVCLWEWTSNPSAEYLWDSVPVLRKVYVFHAYSLASLRDTYWLNNPPSNLGNGYQGFDARYAVTCANGVYSKEQGNLGKLTRIWKDGFKYRPKETVELIDTEKEFFIFQKEIIDEGFSVIANNHLKEITGTTPAPVFCDGITVGYKSESIMYILSSLIGVRRFQPKLQLLCRDNGVKVVVALTEKYKSTIYVFDKGDLQRIANDQKPKNIVSILSQL